MGRKRSLESGPGGRRMRKPLAIGGLIAAAQILGIAGAFAGPWEDGMAGYSRADYLPAIRLFRPLAEQGNPKAQSVLGAMYRRGQGVARNPVRSFVWFSFAAARGDAKAKTGPARGIADHDTRRDFAGPRNGAGLRGVELPELRILIRPSFPARQLARLKRRQAAPECHRGSRRRHAFRGEGRRHPVRHIR